MPLLSLEEPVEQPVARVSRAAGVLISLGAHLLVLLLFLFAPGVADRLLPETILDSLRSRPPVVTERDVPPSATPAIPVPPVKPQTPESRKIPLQFAYVRTPDDNVVEKNPDARLISRLSRRARQEVPTPPQVKNFSLDPHSQGNTLDQVRPDPRLAKGRDSVEPAQRKGDAETESTSRGTDGEETTRAGDGKPLENGAEAVAEGNDSSRGTRRDEGAGALAESVPESGGGGRPKREGGTGRLSAEARESLKRALSGENEESKLLFDNPGYLTPGMATGTMSFDTQGFPWGDYDQKIRTIIRNHWKDRLPLAWREGVRGYTCIHYVIQKDGTITDIQVVLPSAVPPFNRAIVDALRASSPLPPLPKDFPESQEGLIMCYFYNILPQEIRDILGE